MCYFHAGGKVINWRFIYNKSCTDTLFAYPKIMLEICHGCGGKHPPFSGPTHKYMISSPACWKHYGDILAYEYENPDVFASSHRLTVDAYALQHKGHADDRRTYQSLRLHYISLHLVFANGYSQKQATQSLQKLAALEFSPLPKNTVAFDITVQDISPLAADLYQSQITQWAKSAYGAWEVLRPYAENTIATRL